MPTIVFESFGPFASRQSLELEPLTLLIGRNSAGKSVVAYLVWALATIIPDFRTLFEIFESRGGRSYAKKIIDALETHRPGEAKEILEEALVLIAREALPAALAQSLKELLPRIYGRSLEQLVTRGESTAHIEVVSEYINGGFRFTIDAGRGEIRAEALNYAAEQMVAMLEAAWLSVDEEKGVVIVGDETWSSEKLRTVADVYSELPRLLRVMMELAFTPPFFASRENAVLLVDSRAGVLRTMLRPFTAVLSEAPYPDQAFIAYYYMLAEQLTKSLDTLNKAKGFAEELGFDIEPRFESGVYNIYVKTWSGETIPLALAPSGIRESIALVTSLTLPDAPSLIVVEEPEAHLHPRAQILLADLMAGAAARGKWILATTHSDYILYEINNAIIASRGTEKGLKPDMVSAYLVRREGRESILEEISVGPEGLPEDEFARVAEELATRRGLLTLGATQPPQQGEKP